MKVLLTALSLTFFATDAVASTRIIRLAGSRGAHHSVSSDLSQGSLVEQRAESALEARLQTSGGSLEIAHEILIGDQQVAQILVLTTNNTAGRERLNKLIQSLGRKFDNFNLTGVTGIDAHRFRNEQEEMEKGGIPMSNAQRTDWLQVDVGFGPVHKGSSSKDSASNGALACSLGHYKMWQIASNATKGKWTVILEDDALPSPGLTGRSLAEILRAVPVGVDEVFLDDRHCQSNSYSTGVVQGEQLSLYAMGSTAYAVTAEGAKALMAVPFRYNADHWLNVPVRSGAIKAFCPSGVPLFLHEYSHSSVIGSLVQVKPAT